MKFKNCEELNSFYNNVHAKGCTVLLRPRDPNFFIPLAGQITLLGYQIYD